ncbi:MAG TPA: iron ABC transporter permease [Planctomycetota bacterium]|nr:iron ABC transporter permease [Planctomycetota bacterium]
MRDKVIAAAVTGAVVLFFFWALLYPLSFSLIEAVREPVVEVVQKDESWQSFAQRTRISESRLKQLNPGFAKNAVPPASKPLVTGHAFTTRHILRIFDQNSPQLTGIINSLLIAAMVTFCCAAISYPLAYLQARTTFWKQSLLSGLLLLPLVMPPFVGAIGLRRMLAKYGTFNLVLMNLGLVDEAHPIDMLDQFRLLGCVLVMVLHFYPLIYLNLAASISNIDPSLLESAKSLGLTPWQTFRRVVLPLSIPGLVAGGSLVFVGAFTDLGTPLVFGFQETVARQIFSLANEQQSNPAAPALVAVVTVIVLALFALTRWSSRRSVGGGGVKGQSRIAPNPLSTKMTVVAVGLHLLVISIAMLPHLAVTFNALGQRWFMTPLPQVFTLDNMNEALSSSIAVTGMRNSLIFSLCSTAIDIVLGMACAWAIVRGGGWWGKSVDALSLAPLAIPGLVLAFGYVGAYADIYSKPWNGVTIGVGAFLVMSYAVRRLPYIVRSCVAGLEQTPRSLEEAASGLGARPIAVLGRVTMPLIWANIVAGAILAFSFAMLEVSDSLILATRPQDFPLTKSIYQLFGNPGNGDQLASALGLVALVFLAVSLLAAGAFLGKKWGQMFKG